MREPLPRGVRDPACYRSARSSAAWACRSAVGTLSVSRTHHASPPSSSMRSGTSSNGSASAARNTSAPVWNPHAANGPTPGPPRARAQGRPAGAASTTSRSSTSARSTYPASKWTLGRLQRTTQRVGRRCRRRQAAGVLQKVGCAPGRCGRRHAARRPRARGRHRRRGAGREREVRRALLRLVDDGRQPCMEVPSPCRRDPAYATDPRSGCASRTLCPSVSRTPAASAAPRPPAPRLPGIATSRSSRVGRRARPSARQRPGRAQSGAPAARPRDPEGSGDGAPPASEPSAIARPTSSA